jgi:arginyl-tRNA synthetase
MKLTVEKLLTQSLQTLKDAGTIPHDVIIDIKIDRTKDPKHGDFATNIALMLAKPCSMPARNISELLVKEIPPHPLLERIEIAGPGFINFFMRATDRAQIIASVLAKGADFGHSDLGQQQRVLLEFVSANPTGPLHVGHGRSAAFGASLANLLKAAGFHVSCEYYVNDAGRQMNILAVSVWLRYLALIGEDITFPANAYRGEYVYEIAEQIRIKHGHDFAHKWPVISEDLPPDEKDGGDKERYIDAMIQRAQVLLGSSGFAIFHQHALTTVLDDIKDDLAEFGVDYDRWFSEQSLLDDGSIEQ